MDIMRHNIHENLTIFSRKNQVRSTKNKPDFMPLSKQIFLARNCHLCYYNVYVKIQWKTVLAQNPHRKVNRKR